MRPAWIVWLRAYVGLSAQVLSSAVGRKGVGLFDGV